MFLKCRWEKIKVVKEVSKLLPTEVFLDTRIIWD